MSIKINRYPAKEGGNFSMNGRNVMNIPVPDRGFTDLGNSYVVFRVNPTIVSSGTAAPAPVVAGGNVIYPMVFADPTHTAGGTDRSYTTTTAQALIRNSKVTYARAPGVNNERIQQNVWSQNLDWCKNSRGYQDAACPLSAGNTYTYGNIGGSGLPNTPFIQYSRPTTLPAAGTTTLTTPSQMRDVDCRIPMRHVDQLADGMHQFPMSAFGDTNYYLQLENVISTVAPAQMPQEIQCANLTTATDGNIGGANNIVYLTETFASNARLNDLPLYVSAPINLTATVAGGTIITVGTTVTSITVQAGGTIGFTCDPPLAAGGTGIACTDLAYSFMGYDPNSQVYTYPSVGSLVTAGGTAATGTCQGVTASWLVTNAYVELHELQLLPDQAKAAVAALRNLELPFLDVRTIIKNMYTTTTEYSDTVPYDPNCVGLAIMTPQTNTLTSGFDMATQYRHKVDNLDVQGRWVVVGPEQETAGADARLPVGRQYHNYLLDLFYQNMGKRLLKFDAPSVNYPNYIDTNTHAFFPLIVNGKPQGGIVSVNIQTTAGMQAKEVFWHFLYNRAIKIRDGQVVAVL